MKQALFASAMVQGGGKRGDARSPRTVKTSWTNGRRYCFGSGFIM
jgi:hypothetical protein